MRYAAQRVLPHVEAPGFSEGTTRPRPKGGILLSTNRPTSNAATRRERRAAQRQRLQAARATSTSGSALPSFTRSPMFLVTAGAVLVGLLILGVIAVNSLLSSGSTPLVAPAEPAPVSLAHGRTLGDANAPVTLDEWEDFQCPYCDEYTKTVEPRLVSQYVQTGVLKITFHDFAFIGSDIDPNNFESLTAAVAARCAGDQGKFWSYMEYLYANQGVENSGTFNQALFDRIANALSLNQSTFDQCLNDPAKKSDVLAETNTGKQVIAAAGQQNGTPTFFVNGKYVTLPSLAGTYTALAAAIDAAHQSPAPASSASPAAGSASPSASPAAASASPGP